jgi:orotate phosphoribosyltransferase
MSPAETQLLQILKERSFQRGTFRLASGGVSDYYIDGRMSAVFSEAAYLIGEVLYERTKDLPIDAIGGMEVGAVPLTTAAVISYHRHGRKMEGFWVRSKLKEHGTQKRLEGRLAPGARVVVVEDVFTKGTSAATAVEAVRELGCEVVAVMALVDRLQGAEELFRGLGVARFEPIFTIRDFGVATGPQTTG